MTVPATKKRSTWKLPLALAFLGMSFWLSVKPWIESALDPGQPSRENAIPADQAYRGYEVETDLLRRHGSFDGSPKDLTDPFRWFATEPDPGPGGIASIQQIHATSTSATVVQTEVQAAEEEPIPQIQVRLIMRAQSSARVIVDGQVLGLGDLTKAGRIVEIVDTGIHTLYRGKKLFFALSPR